MEVARHETSTAERYADLIRVYLQPTFGSMVAGKLDAELLERFYGRLLRCRKLCSGAKRRGHTCEPLAPNTVRKIHFVVRSALALGVRWRHLGVNEAAIAQPPAFEPHDPDPPSPAEAAALLNEVADDPEWCLFLWLTMTTGSRRGEMCALRWSDLDLPRRTVSVAHNTDGKTVKSTKTHQGRRIALDDVAVEMLTAFKQQRIELSTKADRPAGVRRGEPARILQLPRDVRGRGGPYGVGVRGLLAGAGAGLGGDHDGRTARRHAPSGPSSRGDRSVRTARRAVGTHRGHADVGDPICRARLRDGCALG
jgi:integrase